MIVFVHLLNDNSGSPKVLKSVIDALSLKDRNLFLYLGSCGDGVLSNAGIPIRNYWYRRFPWRVVTLISYMASQIHLLLKLLRDSNIQQDAIIYVNTLLPFAAGVYGKLTSRRVIYHIHEVSIKPGMLRWMLVYFARMTSNLNIYVSEAHKYALPIPGVPDARIYNALTTSFALRAKSISYSHTHDGKFVVLMIASLRDYKGVPEFLALSQRFLDYPHVSFVLLVNDEEKDILRYFSKKQVSSNVNIHSRVSSPASFYERASLLLNLSRVDQCVETFGLTILEALAYGIPVIVPNVGGPAEIVKDGVEGYTIDSRNVSLLEEKVHYLFGNPKICTLMSDAARKRSEDFMYKAFAEATFAAIDRV